ncbi:MutL, C-terminal, dimerization [Kalmanozyma brasiliensis GHG001]|nr:MutL, C-terminal, dimerization [Kalmanozyma brasiliensis GHG001]KAF6766837.1 MutL, C-terminal, dimerization [Kalmanozyma brasiliensis GHG001]
MTEWRHPVNGRLFHIDLRTGHSVAIGGRSAADSGSASTTVLTAFSPVRRPSLRKLDLGTSTLRKAAVFDDAGSVDEFDDPVLDAALAAIPSPTSRAPPDVQNLSFDSSCPGSSLMQTCARPRDVVEKHENATLSGTTTLELAITRSALQQANVIDQMDSKFILCCTASTVPGTGMIMFCVDQHAADERYRLERLLDKYIADCIAGTAAHPLPSSLTLTITTEQQALIKGSSAITTGLARMGWSIKDAFLIHSKLGHAQVDLGGVPYVLKDKALTERGSIKDMGLLERTFAECLDEAASWADAIAKHLDWLTLSRFMPGSLMNVIKSTACRSAIMFNDALSREASERLVRRLGECRFPFQCAHGRPSLVPLCGVKMVQHREEDTTTQGLSTTLNRPSQ